MNTFTIIHSNNKCRCRTGLLNTVNGKVKTPAFFPVATQGCVKTLLPADLEECGVQGLLSNIYHLYLRPGIEIIQDSAGLHNFMGWHRPIITDSGGYQIFSMADLKKVRVDGVEFNSHIDGSSHFLRPADVVDMQFRVRSSVVVPLDECLHYPVTYGKAKESLKVTTSWAEFTYKEFNFCRDKYSYNPLLLGIIQGATHLELRKQAIDSLLSLGFKHFALGGLSVGEPLELRSEIISYIVDNSPVDSFKYLMGVGKPKDILESVERGIDLFDCVIPTRLARTGTAFSNKGKIVVRNAEYKSDTEPLDADCSCFVCKEFSRAYLRHLINAGEISGARLLSYHNIWWFSRFMESIRESIEQDRFSQFKQDFLSKYEG